MGVCISFSQQIKYFIRKGDHFLLYFPTRIEITLTLFCIYDKVHHKLEENCWIFKTVNVRFNISGFFSQMGVKFTKPVG